MTAPRHCPGFDWLASRNALCDRCRLPPWEHDHMIVVAGFDGNLLACPWSTLTINEWTARGTVDTARSRHLHAIAGNPPATQ